MYKISAYLPGQYKIHVSCQPCFFGFPVKKHLELMPRNDLRRQLKMVLKYYFRPCVNCGLYNICILNALLPSVILSYAKNKSTYCFCFQFYFMCTKKKKKTCAMANKTSLCCIFLANKTHRKPSGIRKKRKNLLHPGYYL